MKTATEKQTLNLADLHTSLKRQGFCRIMASTDLLPPSIANQASAGEPNADEFWATGTDLVAISPVRYWLVRYGTVLQTGKLTKA